MNWSRTNDSSEYVEATKHTEKKSINLQTRSSWMVSPQWGKPQCSPVYTTAQGPLI